MKKYLTLILMLGVMLVSVGSVSAAIHVDGVTLDGGSSVTVEAGDTANTEVTVTTSGFFDNWESTSYMIEGAGWNCVDTTDYTTDGTYSDSFTITIPALIAGDYDFSVRAYQYGDHCSGNYDSYTLDDGIIVEGDEDGCSGCELEIQSPEEGSYQNDDVPIEWVAEGCDSEAFNLYYKLGDCESENPFMQIASNVVGHSYNWTSGIEDKEVCVKVNAAECCGSDTQEFYIDNLDPIADANGETCWCDGEFYCPDPENECPQGCCDSYCVNDVYTCYEGDTITLDGSNSYDNGDFSSGIVSWEWYVNGSYVGEGEELEYECLDGDQTLDVELVVTDDAGNSDSDDESVIDVINVDPVCEGIDAPTDVAIGQPVEFTGYGSDVMADTPLIYNWNFGDGETTDDENPTIHVYDTEGIMEVTLTVEDGDGGSDTCTHMIDVVDPEDLSPQEVAAFYPLITDFNGLSANKFSHNISGETCEKIAGPENLRVQNDGAGYCRVRWEKGISTSANPTNADRGEYNVIIKVYNSTDYEYYEFNLTVYSWMIPLKEGWNLISIPLIAEDSSKPGDVFNHTTVGGQIEQIWSYEYNSDTDESEWWCVQPTSSVGGQCGTGINKITSIEPGRAYWVKLKDDVSSVVVKGMGISPNEVEGPMLPPSIDVPTNAWSLIGRYGIVGLPFHPSTDFDKDRVHGRILNGIALDSVDKIDNDLHVYNESFEIVQNLLNNKGYWLWIEDNAFNNAGYESYAPIDPFYPENSGKTILI